MLLAGAHGMHASVAIVNRHSRASRIDAVFEVVLPEPTINEDTKAFFPIRLKVQFSWPHGLDSALI